VDLGDEGGAGRNTNKNKRGATTGDPGSSLSVFVDGHSRGYIVRSDKGLSRVVVLDLLYGSVLWAGCVRGCDGPVIQVRRLVQ